MLRSLAALLLAVPSVGAQSLIPVPAHLVKGEGHFVLTVDTRILADGAAVPVAERLRDSLRPATGLPLPIVSRGEKGNIRMVLDARATSLGDEGYRIEIRPEGAEIRARRPAGLFYGTQTLRQLLPPDIYRQAQVSGATWAFPALTIEDTPRFPWRGSHLDVCRHFMPKSFIKKHLDLMALHKLNVFHWHLTDDQGWRIEIKKFPKLTEAGAWRRETVIPEFMRVDRGSQMRYDATPHGGFYTQEDIREIVRYAADRFITVVPEIEMPGHSTAALVAYPELGNVPDRKLEVVREWGIFESVFSVEDKTFAFLKEVLDEVMGLFPSTFIHIGGDECPKAEWARSGSALQRMKQLGLVGPEVTLADLQNYRNEKGKPADHPALHKLQSWFVQQIDAYLTTKGRRLIGWDEILEGGSIVAEQGATIGRLTPGAVIMS
ncbi:MAG: beta-N-acetylhexosaminidase, partial [Firmicutes bacterium]|nr:beta-N-acetylhexosaminidase [Bacillota bacterium]